MGDEWKIITVECTFKGFETKVSSFLRQEGMYVPSRCGWPQSS